jgi:CelD/BcsL family acetyltransferase involved in cellulose biosynthesis
MSAAVRTSRVLPEERIDALTEDWDDLADRAGGEPWHRPGWFRAFWRAFGAGELQLVEVRRDGRLAAVVPLRRTRAGWSAVTNWHTPTFSLLAEDDDSRAELVERTLALRPASLSLPFLDPVETETIRRGAQAHSYLALERTWVRSPYVPTRGVLDDLWNSGMDVRKRPKELSRREKRLAREVEHIEFVVDDGSENLEDTLAEALPVEGSGWKVELGTAIVSRPDTLQFYTEMPRWAASRGELRLFYYRLNGVIGSFELCLEANNRLDNIKGGINPDFKPLAVGVLTQFNMIKYCFEHGLDSFEFLGDEAVHKRDWTELTRERALVQLFRPDSLGRAAHAAYAYGRPAAKRAIALIRR